MGFPIGGDYLSITEGVLSRIEVGRFLEFRAQRLGRILPHKT